MREVERREEERERGRERGERERDRGRERGERERERGSVFPVCSVFVLVVYFVG